MEKKEEIAALPEGPEGMDIQPYLNQWSLLEPALCKQLSDDTWQFTFDVDHRATCDVVSFHGTGIIEDLIIETVANREGWSFSLTFDRNSETFSATVASSPKEIYSGLNSLNPCIALLTAYLHALTADQAFLSAQ